MLAGLIVDFAGVLTETVDNGADRGADSGAEWPIVSAVRRAREHDVRTGLLSNAGGLGPGGDGWAALFDAIVLSGEVGFGKPDPRIYLLAAERIGLPPGDCVFVDDLAVNVRGAAQAGMVGVHHTDVDTTLDELEALFGFPLR